MFDDVLAQVADIAMVVMGTGLVVDSPLMSAGLDSIGVTELTRKLGERLGTGLASTLLFDHPSVNAISCALCQMGCSREASQSATAVYTESV